ncbi:MAG: S46 family peptidase [Gammaproteobacteria bacterium]|nr:MAG: S46 family peptidase [Gammaproteobacteria bacterium]
MKTLSRYTFIKTLFAPLTLSATIALANEGMWTPQQLPQVSKDLKATGLEIDPSTLSQLTEFPMGAIVSLGGCTASFVSAQGLVITNHHCVYGSIQYNSTAEKDLIKNGFLAKSIAQELPAAPGSRVLVTVDVRDVSDQIIDNKTAKLAGKKRIDAMEANEKRLVSECETDTGHRCNVHSFYGGLEFHLIKQLEILDVRLVHAPAEGVGKFGGDTDNWMWPRHTGDYGFYRAYVGKDGKPAKFSADNMPYVPKHYLRLATEGLKENDFVMVTGYPGRTNRHRLPSEVNFSFGENYPAFVKASGEIIDIINRETRNRKDAEIKYASTLAGVNNYFKNRQGMLDSYHGGNLLERKQQSFNDLKIWVNADKARKQEFGAGLTATEKLIAERDAITRREFLLSYATPRFLSSARVLFRLANEKSKPDIERESGYQERDASRLEQAQDAIDKRYDEQVDKALVLHFLTQYVAQPKKDQNIAFLSALGLKSGADEASIKTQLDKLYAGSKLGDKATRLSWLTLGVADFKVSDDSFIKAAVALYADDLRREHRDKELSGNIQRAYAQYIKALIAFKNSKGEAVYPDANSTLRVTFGKVTGRASAGADGLGWAPFTTLNGITAKNTGTGEFNAPAAQLDAIKSKKFDKYYDASLASVPVNFLSTLDITGGNSGSPVLNKRAEFTGIAFDGTLDSVISDWDFNNTTTRTIAVDLRYILWQMKVVDKADNLLMELGVH